MKENEYEGWRIDRRIPVPTLMVLFVYSLGIVWWAATTEGRIGKLEADFKRQSSQSQTISSQDRRVTILETKIDNLSQDIRDLKNLIEKRYSTP
ncbi:hypothetical protein SAMN04488056_1235 [Cohaesibacter marisflavi]|uniref:Uncharacterized protein n=1 Tax=Cohaesibacter marisflavi TaxID=655353 RepID=A0A1I5MRC3_9HYPH|nr:hypothetical protein [Cohaesibacter marisflavi]SFP12073.1 hypothetical protein SAMN04488056_1235 [Cohaesibacter marisflavi]